jgi:hypothetical protein
MVDMVEGRRFRWWGDPGQPEQPDSGDLLVLNGSEPERYLLVHGALQVRGKGPAHLWLWVTPAQIGPDGTIPDDVYERIMGNARCYTYVPGRPRHVH